MNHETHVISVDSIARKALQALDSLPDHAKRTLFVVGGGNVLLGSLTDGDIRRGLLAGLEISDPINKYINSNFKFLTKGKDENVRIKEFREEEFFLVPVVDENKELFDILDLRRIKSVLPLTALIMAGGRGERLKPLTDNVPKPMLKVGDKPILEYNVDRLISYGIKDIYISVRYLKEQIMEYFGDGSSRGVKIYYIEETIPLGTLGCLAYIDASLHKDILVMNSDLLTNIDFEAFFKFYKNSDADMALASIPYKVDIPYAVLETDSSNVKSFSEKPTYTYYSNGGIYCMKSSHKESLEAGKHCNATDLMDSILAEAGKKLVHFPLLDYWLDIGKHSDFMQAQEDISHIKF
jgi:dTDP-glucose pyrophosphorylase